jgi:hypothetical protein
MTETEESCPHCIVDGKFRPVTVPLKRIDLRELQAQRSPPTTRFSTVPAPDEVK